ncbi:MAG: phosphopantetheine adenylyltransferase [Pseudomonadales bacterium]|nr:phosphopantetheine adenylyltransferase [Pseudomonadales bacterium]
MNAVSVSLILVGVVHLIPVKGLLGTHQLIGLYGVADLNNDVELLLRHRAILFALLGTFLVYAAFNKGYQPIAIISGLVSTFSFIVLSWHIGEPNELISKVVLVDWAATLILVFAGSVLIYKSFN